MISVIASGLLLTGCGASGTPAGGGATAQTSPGSGGAGNGDTSTSVVTNVCSVVTKADLEAAFGGTWDTMSGAAPLTCDFDLTGNESSSALKPGGAVEIVLKPNYYATSGMALAQSVDGLGEQAGLLGNTLFIKRGVDVIEILTMPFDASANAQAAMVALGKAIYPRF
jgi:hypothetical protein